MVKVVIMAVMMLVVVVFMLVVMSAAAPAVIAMIVMMVVMMCMHTRALHVRVMVVTAEHPYSRRHGRDDDRAYTDGSVPCSL